MSVLYEQSLIFRPSGYFNDSALLERIASPPLGIAKRMENNGKKGNFVNDNPSDKQYSKSAIKKSIENNIENMNLVYSTLLKEMDKIHIWKNDIDFELKNKDKKLQEQMQNSEYQRKIILDYQLKNEGLSLHIHEENQQRSETLQKVAATREMCTALKKYFDTLKEKFEYCCEAKEAVDASNNERLKTIENLAKKFDELHFKDAEDIAYLKNILTAETKKAIDLKEEMDRNSAEAQEKLELSKEALQLVQLEKYDIFKDLEEEKIRSTQFQCEKNELLGKLNHLASVNDESAKQRMEIEYQLKELLNNKVEIENNYSLACNNINELKLKCSEMGRAITNLTGLSEENSAKSKQSITNLEIALNNEKKEVETEKNKCKILMNKIDELELEKSKVEENASRAVDTLIKQHEIAVENLKMKLNTMMEEKNAVSHELLQTKKQIFEQENSIIMLKTQSWEGNSTILSLRDQISNLEKQLQEVNSEKEALLKQKEELKIQVLQSQDLYYDLNSENEELRNIVAEKETNRVKEIKETEMAVNLNICDKVIKNFQDECHIHENSEKNIIECLKAENDVLLKSIKEKDKKIEDLRAEWDRCQKNLDKKDLSIANLNVDYNDLKKEKFRQDLEKCKVCKQCESLRTKCISLGEETIEKKNKLKKLEVEVQQKLNLLKENEIKENKMRKCMQDLIKMLNETQENNSQQLYEKEMENLKLKDKISILEDKLNFGDRKIYEFNCLKEKVSEFETLVDNMKKEQVNELRKLQLENENLRKSLQELECNKNRMVRIPIMKKQALRSTAVQESHKEEYMGRDSSESDCIDVEVLKRNTPSDRVVERRARTPLMTSTPKRFLPDGNKRNLPDILETESKIYESNTNAFFLQPKKQCTDKVQTFPSKRTADTPGQKKFFKTRVPGKEANKPFSWF